MKRILVVSNMYPSKQFPSYGVFVKNFCDQLAELGYNFDISFMTKIQNKYLKIVRYGAFYISTFFRALFGKYELIYIHYPSFSAAPINVARCLRKFEVITNVHGTDVVPLKEGHEKMIGNTKKSIQNSKTVVVPSEYYKQLVIEKYNVDDQKVFVYPSGGINEQIFYPYESELREKKKEEYGIDENAFVMGYVSRINKAKGWDIFIDAIKKANSLKRSNLKIFIVGSGEDDKMLENEIKLLPDYLQAAIIRFPLLDQKKLAEIYNMLDIFLFPTISASESLGLVAIEAMSCGVPVIASDFAAPAYYIVNNFNGFKFKVGDSHELADSIDSYMLLTSTEKEFLKQGALDTGRRYSRQNIEQGLKEIM